MNQAEKKREAALMAMKYVKDDIVVGVGTGSTVAFFIEALASKKHAIEGAIASSVQTEQLLKQYGIPVLDLNAVSSIELYVDGADEVNSRGELIKGGGGALTREKILATAAKQFVVIVDDSKQVSMLGKAFPLPIEVIPMARSFVARQLVKLGGSPDYRQGFITDNQGIILDVHHLEITDPIKLEQQINNICGVISNGIFASRKADVVLTANGNRVDINNIR